ncbi:MAG: hypothetical protein P4M15_09345 [Alphaproteobacteria bacterium]|nr:hypothetical protein [Alphaproteobacteria bacterium]
MTYSLVTASVNPSAFPTTFTINTSHPKNEDSSQAINIGNLQEQSSVVSVSDQGSTAGASVSASFTSQAGDVALLSSDFQNFVSQIETHVQLFNSSGTVIADNQGTAAQQTAYTQWVGSGLTGLPADTYTAVATPLLSDTDLTASVTQQQGTSLAVNSQLTGGDTSEFYNFTLSAGNNIKLAFDAGSQNSSTRVQLYDSSGNLVADSGGNAYQKSNYSALTSGTGLSATTGDYSVKVSYAPGADTTQNIKYNFQLYSGSNYAVVYKNNVTAQPADYTAAGSVTATSDAQAYARQAYHTLTETASSAVNIGWLQQDKSSLNVLSQLTQADSADYYSFTLQAGDNLKFGFDTTQTKNPSALRVQLFDVSGTRVIADSQGNAAQQAAYKELTTTNGLGATPATYVLKVSYADTSNKADTSYVFNLFSGTSYAAQYKTTASPQTYGNALLSGTVGGSASTGMAAYLTNLANGGSVDVISALKSTLA